MERWKLELEFVTPCFLGGANNAGTAEWRAASIRGQLRWWFRAVAGGEFGGDLKKVAAAEERLFGSTAQGSSVRVRLLGDAPGSTSAGGRCGWGQELSAAEIAESWGDPASASRFEIRRDGRVFPSNPIHYLAYGPVVAGNFVRARIEAKEKACFALQLADEIKKEDRQLLARALWAWMHLGGIGARSRRGFGSLRAIKTVGAPVDATMPMSAGSPEEFQEMARRVLGVALGNAPPGGVAEWSHFSLASRVLIAAQGEASWEEAMMEAGAWLVAFRRRYGYPSDPRVSGGTPLANRDYVWAKPNGPSSHADIPDRAGFGMPLPFGQGATITWGDGADNRRASPLLLHISKIGEKFYSVWTHLPARLVPNGQKLKFRNDPPLKHKAPSAQQDAVVKSFLDDLETKKKIAKVLL